MNEISNLEPTLRVLVVFCGSGTSDSVHLQNNSSMTYETCRSSHSAIRLIESQQFDCVIVRFDPLSFDSATQFSQLSDEVARIDAPMISTSTFNPSWIANFTSQAGVVRHFEKFPETNEIVKFLDECSNEGAMNAAGDCP